jgi:hypothetical protein
MTLVRYDTNVFDLDDIYGLDLYDSGDLHNLRVIIRDGKDSFVMKFDSGDAARRVFDSLCEELDVQELLSPESSESTQPPSSSGAVH